MSWIGVDLHTDKFNYCKMEADESTTSGEFDLNAGGIAGFLQVLSPGDMIAVETTGNTSWFRDQVADSVSEMISVNARQFEIVHRSTNKNDRKDAKLLAYYLFKGLLPRSRIKSQLADELSGLLQTREIFVRQRTVMFNRIRSQYVSHGMKLPKSSIASKKRLLSLDLSIFSEPKKFQLELYQWEILHLHEVIGRLEKKVSEQASLMRGYEGLLSVTGIGELSAAVLLAEIDDIGDFSSEGKLSSYFGLVPRSRQSNETVSRGRITRQGSKLVRKFLVQGALSCIRSSPYMRNFYEGIRSRRGHGKAIIATARKLLEIIYRVLRDDLVFEDFNTYTLRKPAAEDR